MSNRIAVACQYTNGTKPCGNRTKNPTGLCPQHKRSVPLKDIHEGTGKKPLMTAIPRVGPVVATSASYTTDQPESNEALVEKLLKDKKQNDSFGAWVRDLFTRTPSVPSGRSSQGSSYAGGSRSSGSDSSSSFDYSNSTNNNSATQDAVNISMGNFG